MIYLCIVIIISLRSPLLVIDLPNQIPRRLVLSHIYPPTNLFNFYQSLIIKSLLPLNMRHDSLLFLDIWWISGFVCIQLAYLSCKGAPWFICVRILSLELSYEDKTLYLHCNVDKSSHVDNWHRNPGFWTIFHHCIWFVLALEPFGI